MTASALTAFIVLSFRSFDNNKKAGNADKINVSRHFHELRGQDLNL